MNTHWFGGARAVGIASSALRPMGALLHRDTVGHPFDARAWQADGPTPDLGKGQPGALGEVATGGRATRSRPFANATGQIVVMWLSSLLVRDFGAGLTTHPPGCRPRAGRARGPGWARH
jgi:hypothetical protein